jgi:uncharacterized membrane protein (UPF0127 family)
MSKRHRKKSERPVKTPRRRFVALPWVVGLVIVVAAAYILMRPARPLVAPRVSSEARPIPDFTKQGELKFLTSSDELITTLDIEIADNENTRQMGLMFRRHLAMNQGMLFIFPFQEEQSFWMKNTRISLDMIFVNSAQEIVTIRRNTTPYSEESYTSTAPAQYVVEVPAGFADRFGVNVGDRIRWSRM